MLIPDPGQLCDYDWRERVERLYEELGKAMDEPPEQPSPEAATKSAGISFTASDGTKYTVCTTFDPPLPAKYKVETTLSGGQSMSINVGDIAWRGFVPGGGE